LKAKPDILQSDTEQVDAFISKTDASIRDRVEMLRNIILTADMMVGERIKWNNPSFFYLGEMPPFDPKEHKRDIAVFNLFKNRVMLVFPSGSSIDDNSGFFQGTYTDGRRTLIFKDQDEINDKKEYLQSIIRKWISKVDQS
jgi:hypothetical protein